MLFELHQVCLARNHLPVFKGAFSAPSHVTALQSEAAAGENSLVLVLLPGELVWLLLYPRLPPSGEECNFSCHNPKSEKLYHRLS